MGPQFRSAAELNPGHVRPEKVPCWVATGRERQHEKWRGLFQALLSMLASQAEKKEKEDARACSEVTEPALCHANLMGGQRKVTTKGTGPVSGHQ